MLFGILGTSGVWASVDENLLQQLEQRQDLADQQRLRDYADRWTWTETHIGLMRPTQGPRHVTFHRATNQGDEEIPVYASMVINLGTDAVDTIRAIEDIWDDLGPYARDPLTWICARIHPTVALSQLPQDREHWIIVRRSTRHARLPDFEPVLVEIRWDSWGSAEVATTVWWLIRRTSKLLILREFGVLRACGSSHVCTLLHNGARIGDEGVTLAFGDFLALQATPVDMTTRADVLIPHAMMRVRTPSDASTMEQAESEPSHDNAPDDLVSVEDPDDYPCHFVIYRRAVPEGIETQYSGLAHARDHLPTEEILDFWPDLRAQPWRLLEVDESYYLDFPQIGCFTVKLLRTRPDLLLYGLRELSLVVLSWKGITYTMADSLSRDLNKQVLLHHFGCQPFAMNAKKNVFSTGVDGLSETPCTLQVGRDNISTLI